jgi:hypothetical protein
VVGFLVATQDLTYLCWDLNKYKSCDNILAPFPGTIEPIFLNDTSLVSFFGSPYLTSLPDDSIEGDSLTSFDNPRRVIWRLH